MTSSLTLKFLGRDEVLFMLKKIAMNDENDNFFDEIFELFVVSKTANGVSDATLRNYHYHKKAISKYLDTNRPMSEITKRDLERILCRKGTVPQGYSKVSTSAPAVWTLSGFSPGWRLWAIGGRIPWRCGVPAIRQWKSSPGRSVLLPGNFLLPYRESLTIQICFDQIKNSAAKKQHLLL